MRTLPKPKIRYEIPPPCKKTDRVAIDLEIFGMDKKRLHRPDNGTFASLQITIDGKTVYMITDEADIQTTVDNISPAVHIFHNAKFDITHLRRWCDYPQRKRLWDTMLVEQIMFSGYYDSFSLADLARRRLDVYLEKEERESFSQVEPTMPLFDKKQGGLGVLEDGFAPLDAQNVLGLPGGKLLNTRTMTKEQAEYAAMDVVATWLVYQDQRAEIGDDDLHIWKHIELPFLWVLLGMDGIKLDTESWIALAQRNEKIAKDIQAKYGHWNTIEPNGKSKKAKEVFEGINLNSPAQVKAHLQSIGYKIKSTGVEILDEISDECEFAKDILVYRTYSKRSSTYGEKFVSDYVEADGKIYGDIFQMGAETGRTSCRHPNLQNQPHDVEYRQCFVAEKGNVLIVADYGAQEPRIAAWWSKDEGLIAALNSDEKLYVRIARDALNINITKESPEYKAIKSTILGIFYGMSAKGLAARIGVEEDEAAHMIETILNTYPGIQAYIEEQLKAKDYVTSIYGRKIWLNKYNNQWTRNVLNAPIQSSAADATKLAARRFLDLYCGEDFYQHTPLRLLVHDEIVIEVPISDKEDAIETLECAMIEVAEAMHDGISAAVDVFPGSNWGCKH